MFFVQVPYVSGIPIILPLSHHDLEKCLGPSSTDTCENTFSIIILARQSHSQIIFAMLCLHGASTASRAILFPLFSVCDEKISAFMSGIIFLDTADATVDYNNINKKMLIHGICGLFRNFSSLGGS